MIWNFNFRRLWKVHGLLFVAVMCIFSACNDCDPSCANGVCVKRICQCDQFYEGDACERSVFASIEGKHTMSNTCDSTFEVVTLSLSDSLPNECWLNNEMQWIFLDSHRFEIPRQPYRNQWVEGEGQIMVDLISMSYRNTDSLAANDCVAELRRPTQP